MDSEAPSRAVNLQTCRQQAQDSKMWFSQTILPLSIEQLRWRPLGGGWSVAQCLEHLNLTLRVWIPLLEATVAGAPVGNSRDAVSCLVPPAAVDVDRLVTHFYELRDKYTKIVSEVIRMDSASLPTAGGIDPLKRSLGAAIGFLAAHDRRHIWQVKRLLKTPGFPQRPVSVVLKRDII